MKKIIILLICVLTVSVCDGQVIKSSDEMQLNFNDVGKIALNGKVKIEDLYSMDDDFVGLKLLGTPVEIKKENYIVHDSWTYIYEDFQVQYVNLGGYMEISEIILYPVRTSAVKIKGVVFKVNTKIEQLLISNDGKKKLKSETRDFKIDVLTEKGEGTSVKFNVLMNENKNTIKSIIIRFSST